MESVPLTPHPAAGAHQVLPFTIWGGGVRGCKWFISRLREMFGGYYSFRNSSCTCP